MVAAPAAAPCGPVVDEDVASLRRIALCAALQLSCAGSSTEPAQVSEVSLERPPLPAADVPPPAEQPPPLDAMEPHAPEDDPEAVPTWLIAEPTDVAHGAASGPVPAAVAAAAPVASGETSPRPRGVFRCDFPEDRKDGVSEGRVALRVTVDVTGKPIDVKIVSDVGGFGQAARHCVLAAEFQPGTDALGALTVSSVTMLVRFVQP